MESNDQCMRTTQSGVWSGGSCRCQAGRSWVGKPEKMVEVEQLYCFHDVLKICQVRWMYLSTIISDTDINAEGCRALFLESIAVSGFFMLVMPPPAQLTPRK